jgi:hypothetical protein
MLTAFFSNLQQWKIAQFFPIQANRDMQEYQNKWADLLHVRIF